MPITIGDGLSFCGHPLLPEQIELLRQITRDFRQLALTELAHTICELFEWKRPNGSLKSRECYLFLLALRERGWLPWLPSPRPHARGGHQTKIDAASDPQPPCTGPLRPYLPLRLEVVESASERKLFEQYIDRYHYLGYRVPYGAQLRYLVRSQQAPHSQLACLLFTSAAWKMAPRDRYIGWEEQARRRNLTRVVNNSRFLILPWVQITNLASHILSAVAARLKSDWRARYAVEPALLETLVDRSRYLGTCYRAANWISVGLTQGRGRMDRSGKAEGARKEIFLYPLKRDWQQQLSGSSLNRS
jgi:hypothetical protein